VLVLAASFLALAAQEPRHAFDELVEGAERIVVARVAAVHRQPGPELLELAIERVLYGSPATRVFALVPERADRAFPPGSGCIAFLEPLEFLDKHSAKIAEEAPRASALASGALWSIDQGHVRPPAGLLSAPLPPSAGPADPQVFELEVLLAWLSARIDASVPTLRATLGGTGPVSWSFLVAPDGSILGGGASTTGLAPDSLSAMWRTVEEARFSELPRRVGTAQGPCLASWKITVRTRAARTTVLIQGDYLEGLAPPERDAAERALRVWRALPIAPER
jgi:hypothetical protein